jgi:hypothetical protein
VTAKPINVTGAADPIQALFCSAVVKGFFLQRRRQGVAAVAIMAAMKWVASQRIRWPGCRVIPAAGVIKDIQRLQLAFTVHGWRDAWRIGI